VIAVRILSTECLPLLDLVGRIEGACYARSRQCLEMPPIALSDWTSASTDRYLAIVSNQ
jgi:hypothetical protein